MLKYIFPSTPKGAEKYGGGMIGENSFFKIFKSDGDDDFEPAFNQVNTFLEANGYSVIESSEFTLIDGYSKEPITLSLSEYQPELILYIERYTTSYTQSKYLTYLLKESKVQLDLQNIENKEEAEQKIAKEMINSLLLADKFGLNIEEIILTMLQKNEY